MIREAMTVLASAASVPAHPHRGSPEGAGPPLAGSPRGVPWVLVQ
ncbi:MAG: hypothetical protein OEW93_10200 [Candidatus Bathyarchaeota archaeon]|nr:hypothetical protein [Candidatus Bathyarchaeota archaeon]